MPDRQPRIVLTRPHHARLSALVSSAVESHPDIGAYLTRELDRAKVVGPEKIGRGVVTMNSRVKFRDDATGERRVVTLVYPGGEDPQSGCVSILSPLGAALIGLEEGQSIAFTTTDGEERSVTVSKVQYQPEAHGRFDL